MQKQVITKILVNTKLIHTGRALGRGAGRLSARQGRSSASPGSASLVLCTLFVETELKTVTYFDFELF